MAKILIADDEPDVLELCKIALQKKKHTISTAETGLLALEKLKREKPDLLILDVMLPDMDGYTVQLQMSQDQSLSHIPVIIITALKPALELFDKFDQVSTFLPKPFQTKDLIEAVDRALKDKRFLEKKYKPYQ